MLKGNSTLVASIFVFIVAIQLEHCALIRYQLDFMTTPNLKMVEPMKTKERPELIFEGRPLIAEKSTSMFSSQPITSSHISQKYGKKGTWRARMTLLCKMN